MVTGNQEVIGDKIMYFPAQPLSSREVEAEMLSSEDTAQGRFIGGGRKARKRAFDSGQNFRGKNCLKWLALAWHDVFHL